MNAAAGHAFAAGLCCVLAVAAHGGEACGSIFPSGPTIPENLLRIEVRLTHRLTGPFPMQSVRLVDDSGAPVEDAFLDLPLPGPDARSVTLLMHPGRVKSGVGANLRMGRALKAGTSVTLRIDDAASRTHVQKTWRVAAPDTEPPKPSAWTLGIPKAGSVAPLVVHLGQPVASTAKDLIAVASPTGERLQGVAALADGETTWRFVPRAAWRAGHYRLMTHPELEDPAGNRACVRFEGRDVVAAACEAGTVTPFELSAKP